MQRGPSIVALVHVDARRDEGLYPRHVPIKRRVPKRRRQHHRVAQPALLGTRLDRGSTRRCSLKLPSRYRGQELPRAHRLRRGVLDLRRAVGGFALKARGAQLREDGHVRRLRLAAGEGRRRLQVELLRGDHLPGAARDVLRPLRAEPRVLLHGARAAGRAALRRAAGLRVRAGARRAVALPPADGVPPLPRRGPPRVLRGPGALEAHRRVLLRHAARRGPRVPARQRRGPLGLRVRVRVPLHLLPHLVRAGLQELGLPREHHDPDLLRDPLLHVHRRLRRGRVHVRAHGHLAEEGPGHVADDLALSLHVGQRRGAAPS